MVLVRLSTHTQIITCETSYAAGKTLVSETVKLFHKFEGGSPRTRALNERGVGKICDFWPITRCISVMVRDRPIPVGYY